MKTSQDPTTSEILHRLVVPIQTRGNLGKSTEAIARCEWMTERSVTWRGYDLDAFNRTLSTTYLEDVVFVEPGPEPEGELIKIFRGLAQSEVTVIDPSAHMNRTILRAMEMVRLTQLCEAVAARVTVLIYPVDEVSDMDDIAQTVEALGDSVDWVIVRNPVKIPTTKFFQGSELESQLFGFGAARLEIPALLSDTRNHLRSREIQLGRGLSPAETLRNPSIQLEYRHKDIATEATQSTERAVTAIKGLEDAIRHGWREVNTDKLAERVHAELERTLLQPLATQCRQLEMAAPALKDAVQHMEDSTRKLRVFHFKGILAAMFMTCLVIMGGCFAYGWWKLSHHYDLMVSAALARILSVNEQNREAFIRLTEMNMPIRVVSVTDSRKQIIPRKFALVMEHAQDVGVEETPNGKRVAIYFEKSSY